RQPDLDADLDEGIWGQVLREFGHCATVYGERKGETMKSRLALLLGSALLTSGVSADPRTEVSARALERIQKEVRHELIMLPYLGVFDNLAYKIEGTEVTLIGEVTRPALKSDAENVVKRIEGVERVNNQIEVLPVSSFDNRLRFKLFRAIYGFGPLQRYS